MSFNTFVILVGLGAIISLILTEIDLHKDGE